MQATTLFIERLVNIVLDDIYIYDLNSMVINSWHHIRSQVGRHQSTIPCQEFRAQKNKAAAQPFWPPDLLNFATRRRLGRQIGSEQVAGVFGRDIKMAQRETKDVQ